jgi:hypothetical protein
MRVLALLLAFAGQALAGQAPAGPPPPPTIGPALQALRAAFEPDARVVRGAGPELTLAKRELRDWVEARLAAETAALDPIAFGNEVQAALADADLFCTDFQIECGSNFLGDVDQVRVARQGEFVTVITAVGIWCGYDESAYAYRWDGARWTRAWAHEELTYTEAAYRPQFIEDVLISDPNAAGARTLLLIGSQASCTGAFKDLYARAWHLDESGGATPVLDWTEFANDGYPPIQGRVRPDDVLFQFNAAGLGSGDPHTAVRHFAIVDGVAQQVDPIAGRPHDFVVEWLGATWDDARGRSESAALEAPHAALYNENGFGDMPQPTLRCTADDLWQVTTALFRGPTRYYRVRWEAPYRFAMVDISDAPYPDCTVADPRGDAYPDLLRADRVR